MDAPAFRLGSCNLISQRIVADFDVYGKGRGDTGLHSSVWIQLMWVSRQHFSGPPLLLIFAESLRGNLRELATRLAVHNRGVSLSESVDGAFILNKGFILHLEPGTGWNVHRLTGFPLGWMQADPSQVLLKLMTIIWNYLWKGPCEFGPEMSGYYADQAYFLEVEQPRVHVLEDTDYLSQTEPGFATFRPP